MRPLPKKKTDEVEVARARNEHPPRSQVLTQLQGIHTCTAAEGKFARAIITHTHISVFRRQTCSSFCLLHHHFLGRGGRRSAVPEAAEIFSLKFERTALVLESKACRWCPVSMCSRESTCSDPHTNLLIAEQPLKPFLSSVELKV